MAKSSIWMPVFLWLNSTGKVRNDHDFIFYNQPKSICGAIEHTGDNRNGIGDGDDETIKVNLALIPSDIEKVIVTVTIHEAEYRQQNFGQIYNAFIRIINDENQQEVCRFTI